MKVFASVLELHGQISQSVAVLQRIMALFCLNEHVRSTFLKNAPKKAWPLMQKLELVYSVVHYLDRGILPARIHLQAERHMDPKNFHSIISTLQIKPLIPSGRLQESYLLAVRGNHQRVGDSVAYYKINPDTQNPGRKDKWPHYMSSRSGKKSHRLDGVMLYNATFNYYHNLPEKRNEAIRTGMRRSGKAEDVQHDIDLIRTRLGGIYWHLLSLSSMDDLSDNPLLPRILINLFGNCGISVFLSISETGDEIIVGLIRKDF